MTMPSPRMAAPDSFDAQIAPFEDTMLQNGFFHVVAAGRTVAAACWKKW